MRLFEVTYHTIDNKVNTVYVNADHASEAHYIVLDDYEDAESIISCHQIK